MRLLSPIILLALTSQAFSLQVPPLQGRVNDYGDVLSNEAEKVLAAKIEDHEKATTDQIVILTIPKLDGDDIARFGQDVGDTWKIGQKGSDNGVIIIQSVLDHKIRIQTGRGVEGALPDAKCKRIISEMVPFFKKNDFKGGYDRAIDSIIASIKQGGVQAAVAPAAPGGKDAAVTVFLIIIILSLGVSGLIIIATLRKDDKQDPQTLISRNRQSTPPPPPPRSYTPQAYSPPSTSKPKKSSGFSSSSSSHSFGSDSSSSSSFDFGGFSSGGGFSGGGGGFDGGGASGDY